MLSRMSSFKNKIETILEHLRALLVNDSYHNIEICDVLLCCHDVDRSDMLEGQAYSRLIDSIAEELIRDGWKCAQFALPPSVLVGNKAWGKPVSANRRLFLGRILLKLHRLVEKTGIRLSTETVNWITSYEQRFYDELFDRTRCRVIITIGSPPTMCKAAHSRGLPVVELLHGIGYTKIPWGWDQQGPELLPKGILSLDDVSTKTFSALNAKGVVIKQIPHPWLKRFLNPEAMRYLPEEWKVVPEWLLGEQRKRILLSLQWGYDGELEKYSGILPNGIIHDEVLSAISATQETVMWLIRLHPVQLRKSRYVRHHKFVRNLCEQLSNCEWQQSSKLPLPLLLNYTDGHITMSSMTAYDAASQGVSSLLLCPTLRFGGFHYGMFQDLLESGYATLGALNAQTILEWVRMVDRRLEPFQFNSSSDCDWTSAVEWMLGSARRDG